MTFIDYLRENKTLDELCALWNEYTADSYPDDRTFSSMGEFCDIFDLPAYEVARMVYFGDIKNWGDRVYVNGYGNFESFNSLDDSPIDLEILADFMQEAEADDYKEWRDQEKNEAE